MRFAEIILPLPLKGTFTYRVPDELADQLRIGTRVLAQFGPKKVFTGTVAKLHDQTPTAYEAKELLDVIDQEPVFHPIQLVYYAWISTYYMCELGEVVDAALPAGLKISSESYLALDPSIEFEGMPLSDREWQLVELLRTGDAKVDDLAKSLGLKSIYTQIKSLASKKAIQLFEQVKDRYTPKTERRLRLHPDYVESATLEVLINELEKRPQQQEVLLAYLKLTHLLENKKANDQGLALAELKEDGVSLSSVKTLVKNGILVEWDQVIARIPTLDQAPLKKPVLTPAQQAAKNEIIAQFQEKETVLLKGVTGSGKTEIYVSLIQDALANGGQVLYLLPEIALTTQIIKRLSRFFGNSFGVYHSKYSENERVEVWQKVLRNEIRLVVGVRSAVFLPFSDLSLVIVDEEHESSYKQYDPSPRYHARDVAIYLASLSHAKTLLGSATPAIETYKNALDGKYGLVRLDERYGEAQLPDIVMADVVRERKQKKLRGNFTSLLLDEIQKALDNKEQVILFQNRRGYAPFMQCQHCGHIPKCPNCDVSLTYHIHQNILICHYCGHKRALPGTCPECESHEIQTVGFGTEKLEEELEILMPGTRIQRMDLDSTRSKFSYQQLIEDFESGQIDVLIGTQMVSKGLDFDRVKLVGIFDADRMINFPDFRAHERAFQLMQQVSGRAGRRAAKGLVIVQTANPAQTILNQVKNHDFEGFFHGELQEREHFHYPPFCRMIRITLWDKDRNKVREATGVLYREIARTLIGYRIVGPVEPLIGKIRNQYLMEMTLKIEKQGVNLSALKDFLLTSRNILLSQRLYKSVRVVFDVDPL